MAGRVSQCWHPTHTNRAMRGLRIALMLCLTAHTAGVGDNYNYQYGGIDDPRNPADLGGSSGPPQAAAPPTAASPSCQYTPPGTNVHFDLSGMKQIVHDFTSATAGGYTYRFNVCGDTIKECNSQPAPASKWRGSKCNNLGDRNTMAMTALDPANPSKGLRLSFTQGDICKKQTPDGGTEMGSRSISYEVSCSGSEGELKNVNEVSMCDYVVQFESKHACPIAPPIHWLKIIALVLLLAFAIYCIGGALYNYKVHQLQGVDAMPNKAMWDEVPGLVRDGAHFSFTHTKVGVTNAYVWLKAKYDEHKQRGVGETTTLNAAPNVSSA